MHLPLRSAIALLPADQAVRTKSLNDSIALAVNELRARQNHTASLLEQSIDRMLDYSIPAHLVPSLQVGQRVRVPLGKRNKPVHGYVVDVHQTSEYPRIKSLFDIDDPRVLIPRPLMELARWMSRYYVTPLGTVLPTGDNQILNVSFAPTDTNKYNNAMGSTPRP